MSIHPAAWHDRQLARARACMAEADRPHAPEEITAAEMALAADPRCRQQSIFQPARDTRQAHGN